MVVFAGVFGLQWMIGLSVDFLRAQGWPMVASFQGAFAVLAVCCTAAYVWLLAFDDGARLAPVRRQA